MQSTTLIGTAEVAQRLRISRSKVIRLVASGEISPAFVVPGYRGQFLFDPTEIEAKAGDE